MLHAPCSLTPAPQCVGHVAPDSPRGQTHSLSNNGAGERGCSVISTSLGWSVELWPFGLQFLTLSLVYFSPLSSLSDSVFGFSLSLSLALMLSLPTLSLYITHNIYTTLSLSLSLPQTHTHFFSFLSHLSVCLFSQPNPFAE